MELPRLWAGELLGERGYNLDFEVHGFSLGYRSAGVPTGARRRGT
jgi:hypothetical protein